MSQLFPKTTFIATSKRYVYREDHENDSSCPGFGVVITATIYIVSPLSLKSSRYDVTITYYKFRCILSSGFYPVSEVCNYVLYGAQWDMCVMIVLTHKQHPWIIH